MIAQFFSSKSSILKNFELGQNEIKKYFGVTICNNLKKNCNTNYFWKKSMGKAKKQQIDKFGQSGQNVSLPSGCLTIILLIDIFWYICFRKVSSD